MHWTWRLTPDIIHSQGVAAGRPGGEGGFSVGYLVVAGSALRPVKRHLLGPLRLGRQPGVQLKAAAVTATSRAVTAQPAIYRPLGKL